MPWKQPSVNSHDSRWNRLSKQMRKDEPLCRLCLSAGQVVPAQVVDHIVPLADGGTHAQENLMPLCKRCHDAIKTPADVRARARVIPCIVKLPGPRLRSMIPSHFDAIEMRWSLATNQTWEQAHRISLAAIDGIIRAARNGELNGLKSMIVVTDDFQKAQYLKQAFHCEIEEIVTDEQEQPNYGGGDWFNAYQANQRSFRRPAVTGNQPQRSED